MGASLVLKLHIKDRGVWVIVKILDGNVQGAIVVIAMAVALDRCMSGQRESGEVKLKKVKVEGSKCKVTIVLPMYVTIPELLFDG